MMKRISRTAVVFGCWVCFFSASAGASQWKTDDFIVRGIDISSQVRTFMTCNGNLPLKGICEKHPEADGYLLDDAALEHLKNYHFILMPGGDYDFFSELLGICEGNSSEDIEDFRQQNPQQAAEIEQFVLSDICPRYETDPDHLYNEFMGAYTRYVEFMEHNGIPVTRLAFSEEEDTRYVGDRVHKLDLLSQTIDGLESDNSTPGGSGYVLIGHSFGGINISDFLVELLGGHRSGTPESRAFADTVVRGWPEDKRAALYAKIKAAVFINTFVQGDKSSETQMKSIAADQGLQSDDPVGYYIEYVLQNYAGGTYPEETPWDKILHFVLRSNRYRVNYYLQDRNTAAGSGTTSVQSAFDAIADDIVVMSIGCIVPRLFPDLRVGPNFIVNQSRSKYRNENELNDGLVDTFGAMLPRDSVEYAVLFGNDHGTLVLHPKVPGITNGDVYNQLPFIKTLLKRLDYRLGTQ